MKDYYHENINGHRDRVKENASRQAVEDPQGHLERNARYRHNHPHRARAKDKVAHEIRMGRLARLPCRVCGSEPAQARIDDTSKPLDVIWLCREHLHERIRLANRNTPVDRWPGYWPSELRIGSGNGHD